MSEFIQKVHVVIEAGTVEKGKPFLLYSTPLSGGVDIPANKHHNDGKAIAKILREMAKDFESGMVGFVGSASPNGVIGVR